MEGKVEKGKVEKGKARKKERGRFGKNAVLEILRDVRMGLRQEGVADGVIRRAIYQAIMNSELGKETVEVGISLSNRVMVSKRY